MEVPPALFLEIEPYRVDRGHVPPEPPEYVTDVPYVRAFENDLSPTRLRLVAALNGLTPPPAEDFDYCELGSAHGDTTATLAATFPHARFVGVDLNADHVASANALAARGALANVRFVLADFEHLDRSTLPQFDYITAHGVMSWVSPQKRRALIDFAATQLKPGGLLHVTYNALPGWAPIEPLRQLIAGRAALVQGDSLARAKEGVKLAEQLSRGGAEYFTDNPACVTMLEKMTRLGMSYVAHEYLHAHWAPFYFAQIAAEMAAGGLFFVGQLPLYLNYKDLAVPPPLAPVFAPISDRIAFESLKDFAINESFRRDVFVKGHPPRSETALRTYLEETLFGGTLAGGSLPREVTLPHQTLKFAGPIFDSLLPVLEKEAASVDTLATRSELSAFERPRIVDAVTRLALAEVIVPRIRAASSLAAPASADVRYRIPSLWNRAALRDGLDTPVTFASEAAGTGIELSTLETVAVLLLTDVPPEARDAWIRERCAHPSFRVIVKGEALTDPEARAGILRDEIEQFRAQRLPRLLELGVLEPA